MKINKKTDWFIGHIISITNKVVDEAPKKVGRFDQPPKDMAIFDQPPKKVKRLYHPHKKVERFD